MNDKKGMRELFRNVLVLDCGGGLPDCMCSSNFIKLSEFTIYKRCLYKYDLKKKKDKASFSSNWSDAGKQDPIASNPPGERVCGETLLWTRDPSQPFALLTIAGFDTKHLAQSL